MPTIGGMSYGFSAAGVADYLEEIQSGALKNAKEAVLKTSDVETVCNDCWAGKAKEKFIENFKKDAQHVADQFDNLYAVLKKEVNDILEVMATKDRTLID